MSELPELANVVREITRDPMTWTTIYECRICGQLWEERFEEMGHGEVPSLRKLSSVD